MSVPENHRFRRMDIVKLIQTHNKIRKIKLLFVCDSAQEFNELKNSLKEADLPVQLENTNSFEQFQTIIKKHYFDAILTEFEFPHWNGIQAVRWLHDNNIQTPLLFYTNHLTAELAADCLLAGAQNVILKGNSTRLVRILKEIATKPIILGDIAPRNSQASQIQQTLEGALNAIMILVEQRDPYTTGHSQRVSNLAVAIAHKMNLPAHHLEDLRLAARMHDVGKASLPAEILSKPSELSSPEKKIIRTHPVLGANILRPLSFSSNLARIVEEHHEKMDGTGYPKGLKGDEISIEARIIGVADLVDSISTHRPYRPAKKLSEAIQDLKEQSGIKYDANVINALFELVEDGYFTFNP